MFYTLLYMNCEDAIATTSICSVRDAYRVVYAIVRGASLVDLEGGEMTAETIALVAGFLLLLAAFAVALLVTLLMAASNLDADQIALESFWEPKLAFVLSSGDKESSAARLDSHHNKGEFASALARVWDTFTLPWGRNWSRKDKNWYAKSVRSRVAAWIYGGLAVIIIPLWTILGCVTFGLLWPPQLRRWIFRPIVVDGKKRAEKQSTELSASHLTDIRREMMMMKLMSYEKSIDVEKELRQLKEFLYAVMKEE
jgi:hypothetical protein